MHTNISNSEHIRIQRYSRNIKREEARETDFALNRKRVKNTLKLWVKRKITESEISEKERNDQKERSC